jgi:hypothetical protein
MIHFLLNQIIIVIRKRLGSRCSKLSFMPAVKMKKSVLTTLNIKVTDFGSA